MFADSSGSSLIDQLRDLLNCEFDQANGLLPRYRWVVLKEIIDSIASFKVLVKDAYRHAGSAKHSCPTKRRWISADD